ncbi:hypothetical protein FKM82_006364 [Ascaphus truei]
MLHLDAHTSQVCKILTRALFCLVVGEEKGILSPWAAKTTIPSYLFSFFLSDLSKSRGSVSVFFVLFQTKYSRERALSPSLSLYTGCSS